MGQPSSARLLLQLVRAQNEDLRARNSFLQEALGDAHHEKEVLREELESTRELLREALAAAAQVVAEPAAPPPPPAPPFEVPAAPRPLPAACGLTASASSVARASSAVHGLTKLRAHSQPMQSKPAVSDHERRQRAASERAARRSEVLAAALIIQPWCRGWITRNRLVRWYTEEGAALHCTSVYTQLGTEVCYTTTLLS